MKRLIKKQLLMESAVLVIMLAVGLGATQHWKSEKVRMEREIAIKMQETQAALIDAYFEMRQMPLKGYGLKMVREAVVNGLDWRLLPAIAVRESSGGLHACGANVFGWASCKRTFQTINEAIETVARHLGGNATSTRAYYANKTTEEKLRAYNPPSIVSTYTAEVLAIMRRIAP